MELTTRQLRRLIREATREQVQGKYTKQLRDQLAAARQTVADMVAAADDQGAAQEQGMKIAKEISQLIKVLDSGIFAAATGGPDAKPAPATPRPEKKRWWQR